MGNVRRVYVEKKPDFAVKAKELKHEVKHYLGIAADQVRVLIRYDVENVSDATYQKALQTVFSEPPVDDIYEENFDAEGGNVFSVEFLPGQFDQRADSAEQCVKLLNEDEEPIIRSATTYVIKGDITEDELEAIKKYCINPVDSRETGMDKPDTLVQNFDEPADVAVFCSIGPYPFSFSSSICSAVRRHCQTIALYTGSPVFLSQTIVVSRWFVMPMARIFLDDAPIFAIASMATDIWEDQISLGFCSTQPGCG